MPKQIVWSHLAENDFVSILEFLQHNWGQKVLENFIELTNAITNQIIQNPKQFPLINKKRQIRKCVISKQNTIFYKISPHSIYILRIYDTRQNPKSLKFI